MEETLTSLRSRPHQKKNWEPKERQKQSRAFKRSLRAHRLRLEKLALGAKLIADTVAEIYAKRESGFFMNENEREMAAEVELRVWRIRVAARGVRWFKHRAPEYEELAQNLKEIILLEIAKNNSICKHLRERYQSVVWGQKGWKADMDLAESDKERVEWDSERSEESDESEERDESEDTEDESEEDYDGGENRRRSNSRGSGKSVDSMKKRFPLIRLVVKPGRQE